MDGLQRKRQLRRPGPVAGAETLTPNAKTVAHQSYYTPHKYLLATEALNAGTSIAEWLDNTVRSGYSKFAPAFTRKG